MKNKYFLFLFFIFVFYPCNIIVSVKIDQVSFSDSYNLFKLNEIKKSYTFEEAEFSIFKQFEKYMTINISPEECELIEVDGWHYLRVGNLTSFTKPGNPQLPVKTLVVKLPKNSEVIDISIIDGKYKEILNKVNIIPTPQPLRIKSNISEENYKNLEIYNLNSYFPGKIFSYDIGNDNENKYVLIRFYPVQYIPIEKKAILITNAKIKILYQITDDLQWQYSNSKAIIITSQELKLQADALAKFHNIRGVPTEVVTTQYIWNNYNAAPDPEYEGYKDSFLPGINNISKYNYTLAKKIISFLNQTNNIKYVILFGNARIIPPSYYMYIEENAISKDDYYNRWIPTDYFYISPDYDLIPNYIVGRIPVNNTDEAAKFIHKLNNWSLNLDWSWFKNVAVAGGRPFLYPWRGRYDEKFTGEIIATNIINNYLSEMNITKLFRSDNKFNKSSMKNVLSGNYGFVYHIDHGEGDNLIADKESLHAFDIMSMDANSRVPIVVSVACMNGAYDADLMPNNLFKYAQTMSIGESIIKSNAGGIAYIGGSRLNYDASVAYFKNGYIQYVKEKYMPEIVSNVFKAYYEGNNSIGELTKSAILQYVIDNDFSEDIYNKITLFGFVLLGDPVLKIPIQQSKKYIDKPKLYVVNPQGKRASYFAYGDIPTYSSGAEVIVKCHANSSIVKIKLIAIDKVGNETIDVKNINVVNGSANYTFTIGDSHLYLVRCIDNNKEGWLYVNQPYVIFTDFYSTDVEDIDSDNYYDYLIISIGVDVIKPGKYIITGRLCDNVQCISALFEANLNSTGSQIVRLKFDGHKIYKLRMIGNYQLMDIKIYNKKGPKDYMRVDYRRAPYITPSYNYTQFEPEVLKTAYIVSREYTEGDAGINTDETPSFNYLMANITVYAKKAGYYNIRGVLYSSYYYRIAAASNYTYLDEGFQNVSLKFDGRVIYFFGDFYKGIIGRYNLYIAILDKEGNLLNSTSLQTRQIYNYAEFERMKNIFIDYSSSAVDINNNGKYEYLAFTAELRIPSSGYYIIGANLEDSKGNIIDSVFVKKKLAHGINKIQLNFSGWKIYSQGVNGPYKVVDLQISDRAGILDYKINPHNTSPYSYTSFESIPWKIILVDDDGGSYFEEYYKDALDANGYTYKYWNVHDKGSPDFHVLSSYNVVIWLTGDTNTETLTSEDRNNLQSYLDAGGKLFISGNNIGYDIGYTSFYRNYLHANYIGNNKRTNEIKGIYSDYISHGLNINIYCKSPDVISVRSGAVKIFDYVGGLYPMYPTAGLRYEGKYKLVYLPFDFGCASKQYILMDRIIKWLLQPTKFKNYIDYGEDTDGDKLYDYLVINITLNVSKAGNYTISGLLYDKNLNYIDECKIRRYLSAGIQIVQLKFDGYKIYNNGVSGRYRLKFLTIEDADNINKYPLDYAIAPYNTSYYLYTVFDRIFTGNYSESTDNIYEEGDAKYRYLIINIGVNITIPGNYMISGELYDNNSLFIAKASNFTYLSSGIQIVTLNFKGSDVYKSGANGKYHLKNLLIKNMKETIDHKLKAYITFPYNYSDFKIVTHVEPRISLNKIPSSYLLPLSGGNVTYYYIVTNIGNVNLTNINVTDDKCLPVICPKIMLKPNENMTCNCTATINETTINIANVTAFYENQIVKATASAIVIVNCTKFDLDGNNIIDIFDVVAGLEHLNKETQIHNERCTARNLYEIDLFDLLTLINNII